jgi:hypothetical protein
MVHKKDKGVIGYLYWISYTVFGVREEGRQNRASIVGAINKGQGILVILCLFFRKISLSLEF